jgi:outer membrane lipoprotein SlyB
METNQIASSPSYQPGFADRMQHSKALVAIVAVLGVTVLALAAALVVNRSDAQQGVNGAPLAATTPAPLAVTAVPAPVPTPAPVPAKVVTAPKPVYSANHTPPAVVARANVCADCGTVENVTAVKRQGKVNGVAVGNTTIGLGTVAGGVLGGLLGHQVGGGNGKTAMAVLGAAGGAYAGNKIEQNMKTVTVYDVRVRMDDGTVRNMDISSAVPVGSKVIVEGKNLRLANATS